MSTDKGKDVNYLFPLSYSIPLKAVKNVKQSKKTRLFSPLIPGEKKTYIYKDEICYNKNYEESYFSFTYKKGGHDCLRHYEILANNSIPYYINIDEIPNETMTTFPKNIIKNAMKCLHNNKNNLEKFDQYIHDLNKYTINNLTCEKTACNFINLMKNLNDNKILNNVLMLSNGRVNYSMMTLAYGMRKNLEDSFIDFPKMNSLYTKKNFNLYLEDNIKIDRNNIADKITNKFYDFIIIGPVGPDEYWEQSFFKNYEELVLSSYKKTEIVYIFGGDRPFNIKHSNMFNKILQNFMQKGVCFVRELDNTTDYYHDNTWTNYVTKCELEWNKKINLAYSINKCIQEL